MDFKLKACLTSIFLFLQINLSAQEKTEKLKRYLLEKFQKKNHLKNLRLNINACDF